MSTRCCRRKPTHGCCIRRCWSRKRSPHGCRPCRPSPSTARPPDDVSLGILARCDGGGLASITREVHRHLAPTRTLLLDLEEQGRGDCTPDDYLAGDVFRCA